MSNNSRRRGMSPLLAFFLGFLFGIIVLIGAVAGAVFFALNYKLDKISANKDGDGNYIYINADPNDGGVENALGLIKKVTEISKNPSALTIGQIEDLLPVANKLTDAIGGMLGGYINIDMDELKAVQFSALGNYLQDVIMELQPAALMDKLGINLGDNVIVQSILYDEDGNPVTLRAFADGDALEALYGKKVIDMVGATDALASKLLGELTLGDLVNGDANFTEILNGLTVPEFVEVDPNNKLMVYFAYGISSLKNSNGEYAGVFTLPDETQVKCYLDTELTESGKYKVTEAYWFDGDGNRVVIEGTTINDINSRVENLMDELTVPDIIQVNAPVETNSNTIMIFLAYSVSDITAEEGEGYSYTGTYHFADGGEEKCYIFAEGVEIDDVCFLRDGEYVSVERTVVSKVATQVNRLPGTLKIKDVILISPTDKIMSKLGEYKINEIGNAANELTLDDFITVTVSDNNDTSEVIISYVVYGLTDIKSGGGYTAGEYYTHTAKYHGTDGEVKDCYIICKDGSVTKVFTDNNGEAEEIHGTKVNGVSARVSGITKDLTIGELIAVDDGNMLMKAISGSTIESLAADIASLAVNELYADSIYSASANEKDGTVLRYKAVSADQMQEITSYKENIIYYTRSNGVYALAGTTGKLNAEEFGKLISDGAVLYFAGEGNILFDTAYLYYTYDADGDKYTLINSGADNAGKLNSLSGGEYYTYGAANAMWKLMTYSDGSETAFSVNGLTNMITNVSANIQNSTMRELDEAGIVDMGGNLDKTLNWGTGSAKLGDMTLKALLDAVVNISTMQGGGINP